jgi:ribosomal-protein-alanine N-acetyltransferase
VELKSGTILVRPYRREDAEPLQRLADDRRVWLGLRDAFPHPYGLNDARRFIALARKKSPPSSFAIEVAGEFAGGIGFTLHADVERVGAEVGYWLGQSFWGRGVATEALRLLTRDVFETHRELRRLYAVPFSSNAASARVLEKAGYRREGTLRQSAIKDGKVLDQWMYSILRDELSEPKECG